MATKNSLCFYRYKLYWKYPIHAVLNLTDNCNLACHYCFINQHPHNMPFQIAKDTIDWLQANYEFRVTKELSPASTDMPGIVLFGGEPVLVWDELVEPIIKYIRSKYKSKFKISMTTNSTLLNKERIDFLFSNGVSLMTSMDGDKPTQDLTRPCKNGQSSFDLMINNIKYILQKNPNTPFRATLNQENASMLFHNYKFAESLGYQQCSFVTNKREKWTEENIQILENEVAKIFDYNKEYFENNITPPLVSGLIENGYFNALQYSSHQGEMIPIQRKYPSCGIGRNYIAINYEGKIFGCQEEAQANNTIFEIGNIYSGMDMIKQLTLIDSITNDLKYGITCEKPELCKTCKNILTCQGSMCPAACIDAFGSCQIQSEINCRYKNAYTTNALRLIKELKENQCFQTYLKDLHHD